MRIFTAPQLDSQLRRKLYEGRFDAYTYRHLPTYEKIVEKFA